MAGHLCFGSFLKILTLCSPRSTTQKFLCGTMFLAVNPMYDIRDDDGTVGHLVNCSNNISPAITDEISPEHASSVLACFETQIIPKLYPEKRKHIVHALLDLLFQDDDIADDVRIGTITSNTKRSPLYFTVITPFAINVVCISAFAIFASISETFC